MGVTTIHYGEQHGEIEKLINSLDRPGDYCVHSKLVTPMPRLNVNRVGTIAFPVQITQLGALIGAAERAPYGRGPDTVLDRSVRDSWQIDRKKFQLGGPGWERTLKTIIGRVAKGLGCDEKRLEARPYKLLVYEPGGFFEPHRDTEKKVGMIGTLVVSFPTEGSGGELVVTHKGREQVIDLCVDDPGTLAFAAFYADCTHETRPVREGHRVSLVFNLILHGKRSSGAGRAPDYRSEAEELCGLLQQWVRDPNGTAKIVWLLDHDYSRAGLSFSKLKGTDAVVASTLSAAAKHAECTIHAAIVHVTELGYPDYSWGYEDLGDLEMDEVTDGYCTLKDWVALDDTRPRYGALPLADGELMPDGALDDAYPDDKWVEEASGNAGVSVEHVYRHAALVVWPTEQTIQMLSSTDISAAIEYVESEAGRASGASAERARIRLLGSQLIDAWDRTTRRGELHDKDGKRLRKALSVLEGIGATDLTERFLLQNAIHAYRGKGNNLLATAIANVGADAAAEFLAKFVRSKMAYYPNAVLNLLWLLADAPRHEGMGPWIAPLRSTATLVLDTLPGLLDPSARNQAPTWQKPRPRRPGAEPVGDLLALATLLGLEAEAHDAARLLLRHDSLGPPHKAVPKVLARMVGRYSEAPRSAAYRVLWQSAAESLLQRSGQPPDPPRNWFIDARLRCSCKACRQLVAFCRDPYLQATQIAVARPLRKHLRGKIDALKLDIDYRTERSGSPFKLVCEKNRTSYQRRLDQFGDDLKRMKELIADAPKTGEVQRAPEHLERLRTLAAHSN